MYPIHATDSLQVFYEAGSRDTAVLSFSGIGMGLEFIQKTEFAHSLRDAEVSEQILYILDRKRTWYNATADEVREALKLPMPHFSRVTTLGNSMGGFGAIYFAAEFPACRRAVAFCPQFSVAPGTMPAGENRWPEYRDAIPSHRIGHALERAGPEVEYVLFFGADDPQDLAHAALFGGHGGLKIHLHVVEGCGHDVAKFLRARDALHPLLSHLISDAGPVHGIADVLAARGISLVKA
jgi:pimeloyl-ACP methyl ester carboxylesterase